MWIALILSSWVVIRIGGKSFGWAQAAACLYFIPFWVIWSIWFKKRLLDYRHRFTQLLELLNSG